MLPPFRFPCLALSLRRDDPQRPIWRTSRSAHGILPLDLIGTASARDRFHDLYLFAVLFYEVADEDQATVAAVWPEALGAGVVSVEGVVVAGSFAAVYSGGVHSDLQVCVGRASGSGDSCGASSLYDILIVLYCFCFVYEIVLKFLDT